MNRQGIIPACAFVLCSIMLLWGMVSFGEEPVVVSMKSDEIRALVQSEGYKALREYVGSAKGEWNLKHDVGFFVKLLSLCNQVAASDGLTKEGKDFLLEIVESALEARHSQEEKNYELFEHQADFLAWIIHQVDRKMSELFYLILIE